MSHWTRLIVLLLIAGAATAAQADIVYLRDGSRYYGELVQRTRSEVVFRVATGRDGSSIVRRFPSGQVTGLRKTAQRVPPESLDEPDTADLRGSDDYEQMLREAFELVDDHDLTAALLALQLVVREAPADVLAQLDRETQAERHKGLADFLADVRIRRAIEQESDKLFDLRSPTRYESAALSGRLQAMIAEAMATIIDGRPLAEWIERPEEYERVGKQAREIVHEARLASAMIAARLRLERLRGESRDQRARMGQMRSALTRLAAHVRRLPGYTELPSGADVDDPTRAAARRILERERQRREAEAQAAASQPADESSGAGAGEKPRGESAAQKPAEPGSGPE